MVSRFEHFSSSIFCIYRYIQRIERKEMESYGLKGPHAQCLLTLNRFPQGVTATRLCELCDRDKAAVSRMVSELEDKGMVLRSTPNGNRYRAVPRPDGAGRGGCGPCGAAGQMRRGGSQSGYDGAAAGHHVCRAGSDRR